MPNLLTNLFLFDPLAQLMGGLIVFIMLVVLAFSSRYMQGSVPLHKFYGQIIGTALCAVLMVCAQNIVLFVAAWTGANLLLATLIGSRKQWAANRVAGQKALQTLGLGSVLVALGAGLLVMASGAWTFAGLTTATYTPAVLVAALGLLAMGAFAQSALWPFHKWLLSSVNAPTPVSALMHAGLVNGACILLVRFAPLYLETPYLMQAVFAAGFATALVATSWKLLQTDIKRMLAASTVGQMGFMVAQCGLGLFPAALAHLFCHGLFKGYLFLASGAAAQEQRLNQARLSVPVLLWVLALGIGVTVVFAVVAGFGVSPHNTTFFMLALVLMFAMSIGLATFQACRVQGVVLATAKTALYMVAISAAYGLNVRLFEWLLAPMGLMQPQPMAVLHWLALGALVLAWLGMLKPLHNKYWGRLYVALLNSSQPHQAALTMQRKAYK